MSLQTPARDRPLEKTGPIRPPASDLKGTSSTDESDATHDLTRAPTWRTGAALTIAMVTLFVVALIAVVAPFSPLLALLSTPEGLVGLLLVVAGATYMALLLARGHQRSDEE